MSYTEYPPIAALKEDLQCLWVSDSVSGNISGCARGHLVIPDGCLDLLFQFQGGQFVSSILVGAMTKHFWVPKQNLQTLGIRFHPGVASRYFNFPISTLTDQIVPLAAIWGRRTTELEGRLQDETSWLERMQLVQRWLRKTDLREIRQAPFFAWAWRNAPMLSVQEMAENLRVSRQHLRRLFLENSGLSPKEFIQISRVHRLTKLGSSGIHLSENGFYDQSHMIHQFRRYTGLTPRDYFQQQLQ